MENPSQGYGASPAICDRTLLTVTFQLAQVNAPCLTLVTQAGTRFTYPGGIEG